MGVAKTKALMSFAVTAKLICTFVFAYPYCWFSSAAAQILLCLKSCFKFSTRLDLGEHGDLAVEHQTESRGPGFHSHLGHSVVSLSKKH